MVRETNGASGGGVAKRKTKGCNCTRRNSNVSDKKSECAMRREYRRPLCLCLNVLLLLVPRIVQIMGGGCDASTSFFERSCVC